MARLGRRQSFTRVIIGRRTPFDAAPTTQEIPVTEANLRVSPGNVYSDGVGTRQTSGVLDDATYLLMLTEGSWIKFGYVVDAGAGDLVLNLDTSIYNGLTAEWLPQLAVKVDGGPPTLTQLTYSASPVALSLATNLSTGTHPVEIYFRALGGTSPGGGAFGNVDRWETPLFVVKATGLTIDADGSIAAPTLRPNRMWVFGDSYAAGINALLSNNDSANDMKVAYNDARLSWPFAVAEGLDAEVAVTAYGGQGWEDKGIGNQTVSSNKPALYSGTDANQSWNKFAKGKARDLTEFFTGSGDNFVFIESGVNDGDGNLSQAGVEALLGDMRTALGSDVWIACVEHGGSSPNEATIEAGVAAVAHARTKYISVDDFIDAGTPGEFSGDQAFNGSHPNYIGHLVKKAPVIVQQMQAFRDAASGGGSMGVNQGLHGIEAGIAA